MNISGNLKSLASWCTGFNNVESAWKVCKGTYFFNTDDHEKPKMTAKAKQLAEECGKIFLKYATINGVISLPFTEMGYLNPTNPNTITGIFQHLSKIPYCLVKSALDMNSEFCLEEIMPTVKSSIKVIPDIVSASAKFIPPSPLPGNLNPPPPLPRSLISPSPVPTYLEPYQAIFTLNNYFYYGSFITGLFTLEDSVNRIRNVSVNKDLNGIQKAKIIAAHVGRMYATGLVMGMGYATKVSPLLAHGLVEGLSLSTSDAGRLEKIAMFALPILVNMYPEIVSPLLYVALTATVKSYLGSKSDKFDKIQSVAVPALIYMYPSVMTTGTTFGLWAVTSKIRSFKSIQGQILSVAIPALAYLAYTKFMSQLPGYIAHA